MSEDDPSPGFAGGPVDTRAAQMKEACERDYRNMRKEEQMKQHYAQASQNAGTEAPTAGYTPSTNGVSNVYSRRANISDAAKETMDKGMRLHRFAARLTPEIEEAIEVLQEGIRLGVIRLDGGIERY